MTENEQARPQNIPPGPVASPGSCPAPPRPCRIPSPRTPCISSRQSNTQNSALNSQHFRAPSALTKSVSLVFLVYLVFLVLFGSLSEINQIDTTDQIDDLDQIHVTDKTDRIDQTDLPPSEGRDFWRGKDYSSPDAHPRR